MSKINDRDGTANKAAENNESEATDASVIASPKVQRAARYRELASSLERAASAAKRLADLTPEEEEEPASDEPDEPDEGPITERERPYRNALALLSDGRVALSLAYVEGADISAYERWEGIILEPDQGDEALEAMCGAAADAAGHIGGSILWKKDKPEGDDGNG